MTFDELLAALAAYDLSRVDQQAYEKELRLRDSRSYTDERLDFLGLLSDPRGYSADPERERKKLERELRKERETPKGREDQLKRALRAALDYTVQTDVRDALIDAFLADHSATPCGADDCPMCNRERYGTPARWKHEERYAHLHRSSEKGRPPMEWMDHGWLQWLRETALPKRKDMISFEHFGWNVDPVAVAKAITEKEPPRDYTVTDENTEVQSSEFVLAAQASDKDRLWRLFAPQEGGPFRGKSEMKQDGDWEYHVWARSWKAAKFLAERSAMAPNTVAPGVRQVIPGHPRP